LVSCNRTSIVRCSWLLAARDHQQYSPSWDQF
jgi:hypothetical protein